MLSESVAMLPTKCLQSCSYQIGKEREPVVLALQPKAMEVALRFELEKGSISMGVEEAGCTCCQTDRQEAE